MRGAPEPYVPGRPSSGVAGPVDEGTWPPRIYVPGPAPAHEERSGRLRQGLLAAGQGGLDPRDEEECALALFREPELAEEVLRAMEDELADRGADTVATVGPGGRMVGAALADRAGKPMTAVRTEAGGEVRLAGGPTPDGARVLLVATVLGAGGPIRSAARALEAAGASVVGIVAVADVGAGAGRSSTPRPDAEKITGYNSVSVTDL